MKPRSLILVAVATVLLGGLVAWRCTSRGGATRTSAVGGSGVSSGVTGSSAAGAGKARIDPKTIARATITGTVTDDGKAPIAGASVCADGWSRDIAPELLREPLCTLTDDKGGYTIGSLLPASYAVNASAKTYRPGAYHPKGDKRETTLKLAPGERKSGVDIALRGGGVEITGVVADLTGGPIAHAKVSAGVGWWGGVGTAYGEADDQGRFSLWAKPGEVRVTASADGYADNSEQAHAPGKLEILLTPESSMTGTVVDAVTGQPVEGARVVVSSASEWGWDDGSDTVFSDAQGKFRANRLTPGRYTAVARSETAYGRSDGSTLVGLGQTVDGGVVKIWRAYRIEGKVIIAATKEPCEHPGLTLREITKQRWMETSEREGGIVVADAVRPGTYSVMAECRGYQSRDKYDSITITDKDATGLVWEVDAGSTVHGRVLSKTGEPIEDANVWASTVGGAARSRENWASDQSNRDGSYELKGMKPASYKLEASTERGIAPVDGYRVDVAAGATVEKDLVLDDGGTIKGTVVDSEGKPVSGVNIRATATASRMWSFGGDDHTSDESGAFELTSLRPGEYRVTAQRGWTDQLRKPGSTDDAKQGEKVTVRANQTATVKLVVESQSGVIKGTVVDTDGKPVADAFVSAARESDAAGATRSSVQQTRWSWDEKQVLTSTEGAFTIGKLSPGTYTIRAFRKGGGEAIAEHVAIGSTAKLQIKATGSIEGTAKRPSGPLDEITVNIADATTGFSRRETFYKSAGQFVVHDLPKGTFKITVQGDGGQKQIELELAEGESKTGVTVELDELVTLTGRVVDLASKKPVPAMRMMAALASGGSRFTFSSSGDEEMENVTDESGRFTIKDAPRGKLTITGFPKNFGDDENNYGFVNAVRDVTGTGTVDIGEIGVLAKRIKKGETEGELGINFKQQPPDTQPEQRKLEVSYIDPKGPAAKTDIKVGDVITSIDGVDVTGTNASHSWTLMHAPPGTKLALGLARGATVEVTLAAP